MSGASIEEVKVRLDGTPEPFTCELVRHDERGMIIRWRNEAEFVAGEYRLPAGSLTIAFYWRGRRHNLYRPEDAAGHVICHRLDIIEPPLFEAGRLTFRDMVLDILVPPDGPARLEDEDELAEAVASGLLTKGAASELLDYARSLLPRTPEIIAEAEAWLVEASP